MTFVEELLAKEKEPYKSQSPKAPSKEEIEHKTRHEIIMSGLFGQGIIKTLKQDLWNDVETSQLYKSTMDRYRKRMCIFREKEYREKEKAFRSRYYHDEDTIIGRKERKQSYLDYYLPHCVFDKDEVDFLKEQLQKELVLEGFKVTFDIQEFRFKVCNGFGFGIKKILYGYTMKFTVHW